MAGSFGGFDESPGVVQQAAEVDPAVDELRVETKCGLVGVDRLIEETHHVQRGAEAVMAIGVVGIEFDAAPCGVDRFGRATAL